MWRRTSSRSGTTSYPATIADPELGLLSVHSMLIVVDLPAPLGPRKPNTSPIATSKLIPRTARTSPNVLTRSVTEMAGVATEAWVGVSSASVVAIAAINLALAGGVFVGRRVCLRDVGRAGVLIAGLGVVG